MLLGRVANGLYWMNRYTERAENMARLVDAGLRMALTRTQSAEEEWKSVVLSAGADSSFAAKHGDYTAATVSDFLIRDTTNPSSAMSSMETARFNARMVRTALTRETWEAINEAWMVLKRILANEHRGDYLHNMAEKLLTYALGRGLEYTDTDTLDALVARLEASGDRPSALIHGIIESVPFQQRRLERAKHTAAQARPEPPGS